MIFPTDNTSKQEIKNYCHAFGEFKVDSWASWKAHSEVSLKMILEENKENYYEVLQFAKHLFYGYVHFLLHYKIEDINKHPVEFVNKAVVLEKKSLINFFYSTKLNDDSILLQTQILDLIKNPYWVQYPIEYFDINDSSCIAEAIAKRNFLKYIEKFLDFGINDKKSFSEIVHNEEIEILIAYIELYLTYSENEKPVYTLDQFHLHIQELSFNAFESLSIQLSNFSDKIKSEYVRHYFEVIDKTRSKLIFESKNGNSALTEIMSKLQIQPFTSIDERQYRNVFMEIDNIEYKPSLDDELRLLSGLQKGSIDLLEVKKALAFIYISNLWEMLNNEKQKFPESELSKPSTLPCTFSKDELTLLINTLAQEKKIHFVKNDKAERSKLVDTIFGTGKENDTVIITKMMRFCFFVYVISSPKDLDLKIITTNGNVLKNLKRINGEKKHDTITQNIRNYFNGEHQFISPRKANKNSPTQKISGKDFTKNLSDVMNFDLPTQYKAYKTILETFINLLGEKPKKEK